MHFKKFEWYYFVATFLSRTLYVWSMYRNGKINALFVSKVIVINYVVFFLVLGCNFLLVFLYLLTMCIIVLSILKKIYVYTLKAYVVQWRRKMLWNRLSSMTFHWIRNGSKPDWKIMYSIELQTIFYEY